MRKFLKIKTGFALVEVIVAASIISVSLFSFVSVAQKSVELSKKALYSTEAGFLLEEGAEAVKMIRDGAWTNITSLSTSSTYYLSWSGSAWSLATTASNIGVFTRTVTIANVSRDANDDITTSGGTNDTGTKKITITVSYPYGASTTSKTLSFYISNIFN